MLYKKFSQQTIIPMKVKRHCIINKWKVIETLLVGWSTDNERKGAILHILTVKAE